MVICLFRNIYIIGMFNIAMKRRVVLHGPSTLTVSLPSSWVKKFDVKKGDELDVEEQGNDLLISTDSTNFEKKQIDVSNLRRVGKSCITASYRQGYDEIDFLFEDSSYIETVHDIISRDITGFEVIRQQKNSCVIKDLTGHNKDEFSAALRRIWLLILDMSGESLEIIKKNSSGNLKNIELVDSSINKFSNYCLRILIKKGRYDSKKTPPYYYFVKSLEELADKYKELCRFHSNNISEVDVELVDLFEQVNDYLNSVYGLFYKYNNEKIEEIFEETKVLCDKLFNHNNQIAFFLFFITRDIRNLLPFLIEINM
jgi:phosphate uptake regulator